MNSLKKRFPVALGILVGIYALLFFLQQGAFILITVKASFVNVPIVWLVLRFIYNILIITIIYLVYDKLKNKEDPKECKEIKVIATILVLLPISLFVFDTTRVIYLSIKSQTLISTLNPFIIFEFIIKLISIIFLLVAFLNVLFKKGDKSVTNLMLVLFTILFIFNFIILSVLYIIQFKSFIPLSFIIYYFFRYISSVWLIMLFIGSFRSYIFLIASAMIQAILSIIAIFLQVIQTYSRYTNFIGNEEIGEQFISFTFASFVLKTFSLISIFIFWGVIIYFLIKSFFKIKEGNA